MQHGLPQQFVMSHAAMLSNTAMGHMMQPGKPIFCTFLSMILLTPRVQGALPPSPFFGLFSVVLASLITRLQRLIS
jgi:hypothetical protein